MSCAAAREELTTGSGTQFDPQVVTAFIAILDDEEDAPGLTAVG